MHLLRRSCFRASDVFLLALPLFRLCGVFLSAASRGAGLVSMSIGTDRRREARPGVIVIAAVLRDTYQTALSSLSPLFTLFIPGRKLVN